MGRRWVLAFSNYSALSETAMDGDVDFGRHTEAELLGALRRIDAHKYPINFERLRAALESRGYTVGVSATGSAAAARTAMVDQKVGASVPAAGYRVRLSQGRGLFGKLAPSQNDFYLVGAGTIAVDSAEVTVQARRSAIVIGIPLKARVTLDRQRVVNVETRSEALRFEVVRNRERRSALTLWFEDGQDARKVAGQLPLEKTPDFQPLLDQQLAMDVALVARAPHVPVSIGLLVVNVLVFVATLFGGAGFFVPVGPVEVEWGSNFGPYTTDGEWWRLLTSTFLHFGVLHLALNMWALSAFGPLAERYFGSIAFAALFLVTGVAASAASIAWAPAINSAGASGALFGIIGALFAMLLRQRSAAAYVLTRPQRFSISIFAALSLANGVTHNGIDNAAHVGGLVAGFFLGLVLAHPIGVVEPLRQRRGRAVAAAALGVLLVGVGVAGDLRRADSDVGDARFLRTQRWAIREEAIAIKLFQDALKKNHAGTLDDQHLAEKVSSDVLPIWIDAAMRFKAIELPPNSRYGPTLGSLRSFSASRRDAMEFFVDFERSGDEQALARYKSEMAKGDAIVDAVQSHGRVP